LESSFRDETRPAQAADNEIVRLQGRRTMLVDLVATVGGLIGEQ